MKALNFRVQYLLLPYVLFFLVPAMIVKANIGESTDFGWVTWFAYLFLAVFSFGILQSVGTLLSHFDSEQIFERIVEFGLFFVVITGLFLPISTGVGMMDAHLFEISPRNIFAAMVLAVILSVIASKNKSGTYSILCIYLALNTVLIIPAVQATVESESTNEAIFDLSRTHNVLVLSFDGVPGPVMADVLRGSRTDAEVLAGFKIFERVASGSPATSMSTVASLLGNGDFSNSGKTSDEVWDQRRGELLTTKLVDSGYLVSAYGVYGNALTDKQFVHERFILRYETAGLRVLNISLARALSSAYTIRGELKKPFSWLFNELLRDEDVPGKKFQISAAASVAPAWKRPLTLSFLDYHEYIENLAIRTKQPVAHLLHFTFSHYPVEFDSGCGFHGHDADWYKKNQNREGVLAEAKCVLGLIDRFIKKLEKTGALDTSLIVIKSDHGKPVEYGAHGTLEAKKIKRHEAWGLGRYLPMLAIKRAGSGRQPLAYNQQPVMLDDLARTLCLQVFTFSDCEQYPGFDLLSEDFEGIEEDEVTVFIVKNKDSDYRFRTHDPLHVKRGGHVVESMDTALGGE